MTIPHCYRFNKITNKCPLKECINKEWVQYSKKYKDYFLANYMRVNNLKSIEEANISKKHDQQIRWEKQNDKRIYNEIRDSFQAKQDTYYVKRIPATYNPYNNDSFYDTYIVYKETCRQDNPKYRVKKEMARFNDENSANRLCNQLLNTVKHITKKDVEKYKTCPLCEGKLIEKDGQYGKFIGCANYPNCNYSRKTWGEI